MGEGVVRVRSQRAERVYDKENYIDFRMRLLGEPGELIISSRVHMTLNAHMFYLKTNFIFLHK